MTKTKKMVKQKAEKVVWWVWLRSPYHKDVLYFLGRVEGCMREAVDEAIYKWPQFKGRMKLEMTPRDESRLRNRGILDRYL